MVSASPPDEAPSLCNILWPTYAETYGTNSFDPGFSKMVVFGDSFSDVGNIYDASNGTQPGNHSWDGRYSDGRVWGEYVAQYFDLWLNTSNNFAWGGATTNNNYIDSYSTYLDAPVPGVDMQIETYLNSSISQEDIDGTLHVMFSAYNDYWWYVARNYTVNTGPADPTEVYTAVAGFVVDNMELLYSRGARQFLVANALNMTQEPEALAQPPQVIATYKILVRGHNERLTEELAMFERNFTDATVFRFDVLETLECINVQKDALGFLQVVDACYPNEQPNVACSDIYSFKFWDDYHFTTHAHNILAGSAIQSIYETVVAHPSHTSGAFLRAGPSAFLYWAVWLLLACKMWLF